MNATPSHAKWSDTTLARQCGVATSTLRRHVKTNMRTTIRARLIEYRQWLEEKLFYKGTTVREIADVLGYTHQGEYFQQFKAKWGMCPVQKTANRSTLV
jgi:AraC-like DNA-binding protein